MSLASLNQPADIALACLKETRSVWIQQNGEPLENAFARIFGRPLPEAPLLTVALPLGHRIVTVHLHRGGIACVYDPARGGWELRSLKPENHPEKISNMAGALPSQHCVPISLVGGQRIGLGADVTRGLRDWIRR